MPWFKIIESNGEIFYQNAISKEALIYEYIQNQKWQFEISEWHPKKLNYRHLLILYEEIYNALQSGIHFKQAVSHLSLSSSHKKISVISKAILCELEKGEQLNKILAELAEDNAKPYCQLININGTKEACLNSLETSISQLKMTLDWSQRLLKSLMYPFFLIQLAMIILIINHLLTSDKAEHFKSLLFDISLYITCSIGQLFIINSFIKGAACHWFERYSSSFRLTKFFSLLSTIKNTGTPLQSALKNVASYFTYHEFRQEILTVYYQLCLGRSYTESFPVHWFLKNSKIALHSSQLDGGIERALVMAKFEHEQHWQRKIEVLEKALPAFCLFLAAGFITFTLIKLYTPLLEVS